MHIFFLNIHQLIQMLFLSSFQPCICSGDGGIRTRVPERGKRISSAPRYDHFDTSP